MPEGFAARDAFVAPDDHFCELVIPEGLGEGPVAVQVRISAVTAGTGAAGRANVDIGDEQTYLHSNGALRVGTYWTDRFYSGAPFTCFVPPSTKRLHRRPGTSLWSDAP